MRHLVLTASLVTALAGCTDGNDPAPVDNTPSNVPSATAPSSAPAPALPDLPKGSTELVPPTTATADATLPEFSHKEKGYTILIQCSGGGTIEIKREKEPRLEPFPCDGVPTVHRVRSDVRTHNLKVNVTGDARWGIRIVDGLPSPDESAGS